MGDTPGAYTNVSVLKSWLSGMGEGAATNGVGVLYCCAPPSIHMNGVTVPAAVKGPAKSNTLRQFMTGLLRFECLH